jgi:Tol biopolymer transport system component
MTGDNNLKFQAFRFSPAVGIAAGLLLSGVAFAAAPKMPAAKAGTIGAPTGKIAFMRERDIWVMDATGANQKLVTQVKGADGRMTWAPDGRRIAFTWSGFVDAKLPGGEGGRHKVYDVFIAYLDSAEKKNTNWWKRLTGDLGSRDPEWSADGSRILFTKDMNANIVNAQSPNYQICTMDGDGGSFQILRKDWQMTAGWMQSPTAGPRGDVAFVLYTSQSQAEGTTYNAAGIAIRPISNFMAPIDSLAAMCRRAPQAVAPCWSPDGKWITYVDNKLTDGGLYIATPDFKEQYLVFAPPVSTNLATFQPSFSPDSKWLTFGTTDGSVWICDITGSGAKRISGPGSDMAPAWSKAVKK